MNSPSPLVPQGAIPPKTTSRPQRVLMIAAMVVGLHVAGLSLVLFQGCGKGAGTETAGATNDTSTAAMSYPSVDTNPPSAMFASATNAMAQTNTYVPPAPIAGFGSTTSAAPNLPGLTPDTNLAGGQPIATPDQPALTGNEKDYQIRKGDTLTTIAARNGVSLSGIARINPNLDPKKLRVGQTIKLPGPAPTTVAAAGTGSTPPTGAVGTAVTGQKTYKVKSGDTLTKIARIHGITVNQLRAANNMKTMQVQAGKTLKIPAANQRTAAAPGSTNLH